MGVSTHSKGNAGFIIFSVYQGKDVVQDYAAHCLQRSFFKTFGDIHYTELDGCYLGSEEKSFLISKEVWDASATLRKRVFEIAKQECVMELQTHKHGLYKAWFLYPKIVKHKPTGLFHSRKTYEIGERIFQGYLRSVSKDKLHLFNGYSKNLKGDCFVITKSDATRMDQKQEVGL